MAINVSFNGATIYKPGAYSKTTVDLGGGLPLGPSGLIAVFGEADAGTPGANEVNIADNRYTAQQIVNIRDKYKSGPIVDSANFLFAPASDAAIPSGASTVWFYKTNASTRANVSMDTASYTGEYETLFAKATEWGTGGNRVSYKSVLTPETTAVSTGTAVTYGAVAEVTEVTCVADVAGSLDGTYFIMQETAGSVAFWFDNGDTGTAEPAHGADRSVEINTVTDGDADTVVAGLVQAAINADVGFSAPAPVGAVVTVTNAVAGDVTDATAGTSGFTMNVTTQGDDSDGSSLNGATFDLRVNGGAATTVTLSNTESDHDTITKLASVIDAAVTAAGVTVAESSIVSGALEFTLDAAGDAFKLGYGRNFELIETNAGDLALMGLTAGLYSASVEPSCALTLYSARDLITEEDTSIGGNMVIQFGRDASGTTPANAATVSVTSTQVVLDKNGVEEYSFNISEYGTLKELADNINTLEGWSCSVTDNAYNNLALTVLDRVSDLACFSPAGNTPARIKKDADEVAEFFSLSTLAEIGTATAQQDPTIGLPPAKAETFMTGGTKGATTTQSIIDALTAFEKFHVNSIIPLFSRDAAGADITDELTDGGSTYTIDGINQAVKTHISTMKTTLRRSERQGYLSYKATEAASYAYAQGLADQRLQLMIQDVRAVDGLGTIKWFQPWAMACMVAGARAGSPIGTPLTFKNLNVAGIRHTSQAMTTADADIVIEFDPDLAADQAIQAGITFMEAPTTGGFRIVVDNTTYSRDNNFVYNRGNVMYAADTVAYNLRTSLESQFVGQKNTITAATVASAVEAQMSNFLGQGIIVSSDDAPNGFKNLTVTIEGNTINVGVVVKIVEGIDFVLTDISIQRATTSA